jgi:hypothetical protein
MIVDLAYKRSRNKIRTNKNDYDMIKLSLTNQFTEVELRIRDCQILHRNGKWKKWNLPRKSANRL